MHWHTLQFVRQCHRVPEIDEHQTSLRLTPGGQTCIQPVSFQKKLTDPLYFYQRQRTKADGYSR